MPKPTFTPAVPTNIMVNPIQSQGDWDAQRKACDENLGEFHGKIAEANTHWYHKDQR